MTENRGASVGEVGEVAVSAAVATAHPDVRVLTAEAEVGAVEVIRSEVEARWAVEHGRWHGVEPAHVRSQPAVDAYRRFSLRIGVDPDRQPPSIQALIDRGLRTRPRSAGRGSSRRSTRST